jgi:formiminoglutamase
LRTPASYPPPRYHDPNDKRLVELITPSRRSRSDAVNIIGAPFEGAVLGRKGAGGGPQGIRNAMASFSSYNIDARKSLMDARIYDLGDVVVDDSDVLKTHVAVEEEIFEALNEKSLLVVLGGDNSLSLPGLRAFGRKFGRVGLVVIDSHLDLRGEMGGRPTSGSSYGLAMESVQGLSAHRVVEIAAHGFLNSEYYVEKAKKLGVKLFTAEEVHHMGALQVAKKAYDVASHRAEAVYLSVDLDAVDLAQVSGVSAPSVGGLGATQVFQMVEYMAGRTKTKCADFVETAPSLDPTGRSQLVAATAIVYLIGGHESSSRL